MQGEAHANGSRKNSGSSDIAGNPKDLLVGHSSGFKMVSPSLEYKTCGIYKEQLKGRKYFNTMHPKSISDRQLLIMADSHGKDT